MKNVIDGKRYDTATATEIGTYSNDLPVSDFRNETITLYVTKRGNFFIAGESGPMGYFATSVGNETRGGDGLEALGKEEALEWAERYLDCEDYESYFKGMIEEA